MRLVRSTVTVGGCRSVRSLGGVIVRRIPIILIAFLIGIALELMLLMIGGFDLRIGGDGPASLVLFITHLPAMYLCSALPLKLQTDLAVIIAMTCLLSIAAFMIISLLRMRRSEPRPKAQQVRLTEQPTRLAADIDHEN